MLFDIDSQTVHDIEIFGDKYKKVSIFSLFNKTKTIGGRDKLVEIMNSPITEIEVLISRQETIQYFQMNHIDLKIKSFQIDFIEHYVRLNTKILHRNILDAAFQAISYALKPTNNYYIIKTGIKELTYLLKLLSELLLLYDDKPLPLLFRDQINTIKKILEHAEIVNLIRSKKKLNFLKLNRFDNFFRKEFKNIIADLLQIVYSFDVFETVAKSAREKNFCFPEYIINKTPILLITSLFHPLIENPVTNDIVLDEDHNLYFLTGPNMAGKSTLFKSIGISVYLAHIGFPVPAKKMKTTVFNGIITTINLPDNITQGLSHFYAEVKRVKEVAVKIKEKKNIIVIFDELFRGTNVKDAFDASYMIISSFAGIKSSTFFISTHITEIAEQLTDYNNIIFKFLESDLDDGNPRYSYKLCDGVSCERHGMVIIKKEKIMNILNSIVKEQ